MDPDVTFEHKRMNDCISANSNSVCMRNVRLARYSNFVITHHALRLVIRIKIETLLSDSQKTSGGVRHMSKLQTVTYHFETRHLRFAFADRLMYVPVLCSSSAEPVHERELHRPKSSKIMPYSDTWFCLSNSLTISLPVSYLQSFENIRKNSKTRKRSTGRLLHYIILYYITLHSTLSSAKRLETLSNASYTPNQIMKR